MVQNNQLDHNLKDARRKNSDNNIRFCPVESVTKLQQLFCQNIILWTEEILDLFGSKIDCFEMAFQNAVWIQGNF